MSEGAMTEEVKEEVVVRGKERRSIGRDFIYSLEADCLCAFVRLTRAYTMVAVAHVLVRWRSCFYAILQKWRSFEVLYTMERWYHQTIRTRHLVTVPLHHVTIYRPSVSIGLR